MLDFYSILAFVVIYVVVGLVVRKVYFDYMRKKVGNLHFYAFEYDHESTFVGLFWLFLLVYFPVKIIVVLLIKLNDYLDSK